MRVSVVMISLWMGLAAVHQAIGHTTCAVCQPVLMEHQSRDAAAEELSLLLIQWESLLDTSAFLPNWDNDNPHFGKRKDWQKKVTLAESKIDFSVAIEKVHDHLKMTSLSVMWLSFRPRWRQKVELAESYKSLAEALLELDHHVEDSVFTEKGLQLREQWVRDMVALIDSL